MDRIRHLRDDECKICSIFWSDDRHWSRNQIPVQYVLPGSEVSILCPYRPLMAEAIARFCQDPYNRVANEYLIYWWNRNTLIIRCCCHREHVKDERIEIFNPEGTKLIPGMVELKTLDPDNTADDSWAFVTQSYRDCITNHHLCHFARQDWRPLRLLKISLDGFQLEEEVPPIISTKYIALSYCWGSQSSLRTTSANIESFKNLIPWKDCPAVFRDCVTVANRIGIGYLWIDALCIQQDSEDDWSHNASNMGRIYESAALVLSAVTSSHSNMPFLGLSALNTRTVSRQCTLTSAPGSRNEYGLQARNFEFGSDYSESVFHPAQSEEFWFANSGPLDHRAWAFQERYLARRSLRYTNEEIVWRCRTTRRFESLADYEYRIATRGTQDEEVQGIMFWYDLTRAYTKRKLTFATDKLPAFSGIASRFQEKLQCRYLAGLWESSLAFDLAWFPSHSDGFWSLNSQTAATCSDDFMQGPTWSWASNPFRIDWPFSISTSELQPCIEILAADCSPSTANRWGPVKPGASLTVRAYMLQVRMDAVLEQSTGDLKYGVCQFGDIQASNPFTPDDWLVKQVKQASIDDNRNSLWKRDLRKSHMAIRETGRYLGSSEVTCLLLLQNVKARRLLCLLLSQVEESSNTYQRLGLMHQDVNEASVDYLKSQTRQKTIRLV